MESVSPWCCDQANCESLLQLSWTYAENLCNRTMRPREIERRKRGPIQSSTLSSPGGGRCLRRPAPSGVRRPSADPARRLPIIGRGPQSKAHLRTGSQSSGRRAGKESSACPRASTLCAWSLGAASDGWSSAFQSASGSHVSRAIVCTLKVHTIERAADGGEGRGEDAGEYARHRSLWTTSAASQWRVTWRS